jgi:hypothetical protein
MQRRIGSAVLKLDFGVPAGAAGHSRLRLAAAGGLKGPDKYRLLDLKRRRAQIRARRELALG